MDDFVNLHVHQQYSLLDGIGKAVEWAEVAKELGQSALAVTDHGTLAGIIDHYKACKQVGIKPILGQEFYVTRDRFKKEKGQRDYVHLTILAKNNKGLENMIKLSSLGWTEGFYYKPRIDWKSLYANSGGLIVLSACMSGPISRKVLMGRYKEAEVMARHIASKLEHFYLELIPTVGEDQEKVNRFLIKIAKKTSIPLVVTGDCHYPKKGGAILQDALLMLQQRKTIKDDDRFCYTTRDLYLKDKKGILNAFKKYEILLYKGYKSSLIEGVNNTVSIAKMCNAEIDLGHPILPIYDVKDSSKEMMRRIIEGYKRKLSKFIGNCDKDGYYREKKKYKAQLMREISLIKEMKLCDYFLMIADLIAHAKSIGIRVGGARGSVAGSLVAYCLDITDVDPLKFDLLFERFLSRSRKGVGNIPDIDMDFQHDRRDEIKKYLMERWGEDHVVNVSTYSTLGSRSILKDVSRVYGIPFAESNEATRVIPYGLSIDDALNTVPEFMEFAERHKKVVRIAKGLEGQIRHLGTHAAGVVVFNEPVEKICPLCINAKTRDVLTQWNMYDISDRGFLKLDILGLKTLTVLENCVQHINKREDSHFSLDDISLINKKVYKTFQEGHTVGVFQFENPDFQNLSRLVKPKTINDLAIINALGRPGAKQTGQDTIYLENRKRHSVGGATGKLADILRPTYGAIIFQEQVMEICHEIGGLSLAETNDIRESIKHFKHDVMASFGRKFVKNAIKNSGYTKSRAKALWELVKTHSSYSFNKNHAVAYSIISYQTMYMKVAHPEIYMLYLLKSVEGDQYKTRNYVNECKRLGVSVLSPDLYKSGISYRLTDKNGSPAILLGFTAIKGIGEKKAIIMIKARKVFKKDYVKNLTEGLKKTLLSGEIKM